MKSESIQESLLELLENHYRKTKPLANRNQETDPVCLFPPIVFANFLEIELRFYNPYVGRNPQTGEEVKVPGKYSVAFKMDPKMAEYLNPGSTRPKVEPIVPPKDSAPVEMKRIVESFTEAREKLLRGERAELPGVLTFIIRSKPDRSSQGERKVLSVENLSVDREDDPKNPFFCFKEELDRRLSRLG